MSRPLRRRSANVDKLGRFHQQFASAFSRLTARSGRELAGEIRPVRDENATRIACFVHHYTSRRRSGLLSRIAFVVNIRFDWPNDTNHPVAAKLL